MVNRFILPPNEGPYPNNSLLLRIASYGELQFPPVGGLEIKDFFHITPWVFTRPSDELGLAHRIGIKDKFRDNYGKPATLFLHFIEYLVKQQECSDKLIDKANKIAMSQMHTFSLRILQTYNLPNVVCMPCNSPDWMMSELRAELDKRY